MKLHFKIISHTSQDPNFSVTNLLSKGLWESARFCEYPQQITIQFFQPVTITSLNIVSHPTKISSKINVMFANNQSAKQKGSLKFGKYGYIQFGSNQQSEYKLRELKKIQNINKNCSYIRLILWKNHQNPLNFFNQVGLSQLAFFGTPYSSSTTNLSSSLNKSLPPAITNRSSLLSNSINSFIEEKLILLEQFKSQFSKREDFENAKKVKQIIKVIKMHGQKLKGLDGDKKNAVTNEQYEKAKFIKAEMDQLKSDMQFVANNFYDPENKTIKLVHQQKRISSKLQQIASNNNSFIQNQSRISRLSAKLKNVQKQMMQNDLKSDNLQDNNYEQKQKSQQDEIQTSKVSVSYDNRIIPTVLKRNKKIVQGSQLQEESVVEDNQFIDKKNAQYQEMVVEQMSQIAEVNAAILFEFYQRQIVKKLHSKVWNFKIQALNNIIEQTKKYVQSCSVIQKNRIKAVLFIFNKCIKQVNFKFSLLSLNLLLVLVSCQKKCQSNVQGDLHSDIEKSVNQIYLKMGDSQKMKQKCRQIFIKMLASDIYGANILFQAISKSYFNQTLTHNIKIKKQKLYGIDIILDNKGIGNKTGLPLSSVDFVCKIAEDANAQIRKQATNVLKKMKQKGAGNKVIDTIRSREGLKGSIIKHLQS